MLPSFLQSSLKAYKEDTDAIATWLAVKAKQCGYPKDLLDSTESLSSATSASQSSQSSKRLKGNARKKARDTAKSRPQQIPSTPSVEAKYIIKLKDFTLLANFIAVFNKPVVKVPKSLVVTLNRAIDLRKQHNEYSREQTNSSKPADQITAANESHSYFLGVLERIREILKPRMPSDMNNDFLSKPNFDPEQQSTNDVSNIFANLNIQEPSQAFLDAPDIVPEPKAKPEPRYEAETVHSVYEQYLAAHCLFEDVKCIRSCLHQLWKGYQEGMDIVAASITTNTAIDFVRKMEQDYLSLFPEKSDYEAIVNLFFGVQCRMQGEDPDQMQKVGDQFNFAVYDLAESCLLTTYAILSSVQDVISPDSLPIYKPGHFGNRDKSTEWSEKSPREKYHDDKIVILEAFPDFMLMAMITSKSPLAEDELIRGFRDMAPGKDIPLWLAFAAQCFLDTQHTLKQDTSRPLGQLMKTANAIRASVKQNLNFHQSLRIENWPRQNDFQFSETLRVVEEWVLRDMMAEKLKEVQRNMPVPAPEPYRLLKQYPLLCGLFTFALKVQFQEVSLAFVNAWGSVLYAGHLYNAARQERLLPKAWQDMELVIMLQSTERMFVGDAPTGLEEYLKRFLLSMGWSATAFASNRRKGHPAASARGPRSLMHLGPVGTLFQGRYCKNEKTVAWTSDSITPIIASKMEDDSDDEDTGLDKSLRSLTNAAIKRYEKVKQSATGALLRGPKRDRTSIPTLDFLSDLANALHAEALELSIDYLRLHRFCWMLLRQVNEACKPKLLEFYGPGYLPKESQLPFVVGYIFMTATTTSRVADVLLPRRGEAEISSRLLMTAAESMKTMIDTGAGAFGIKMLEESLGYGVEMEGLDDVR